MFKKKKEAYQFFDKAYNLDKDNLIFALNDALSLYENRIDDNSVWKILELSKGKYNEKKDDYDESEQEYIDKSIQYLQRMKDKENVNVSEINEGNIKKKDIVDDKSKEKKIVEEEKSDVKKVEVKKEEKKNDDDDDEEEEEEEGDD